MTQASLTPRTYRLLREFPTHKGGIYSLKTSNHLLVTVYLMYILIPGGSHATIL